MEQITLGEIAVILTFIVGFITSVKYLKGSFKDWITSAVTTVVKPLEDKLKTVDLENCKNYLVSYLSNLEKGLPVTELETQRFWEEYEHYTDKGGNSYIKNKVEKFQEEGKL